MVNLLLAMGAVLELTDSWGRTPLSYAAENGHEAMIKLLLEEGAELESKDSKFSRTPLLWAAEKGHEAVVKLLLNKGADLESEDSLGRMPLSYAAEDGHKGVVELLLEKGAVFELKDTKYGRTPLLWAAKNGHAAVVQLLLEKGAELESTDSWDRTPLSHAAENGHEAVVKLLLAKGAELESKDNKYGRTPLLWAAGKGHETTVNLLLQTNAVIDTKDKNLWTALLCAVKGGHEIVVRLLLAQKADVNAIASGICALSMATRDQNEIIMGLLFAAGASIEVALGTLESLDAQNFLKQSALYYAIAAGDENMVKMLISIGANVNEASRPGLKAPLHLAAESGEMSVVTALLEANADPTKEDELSRTPLHYARQAGLQPVAQTLESAISRYNKIYDLGLCYRMGSGGSAVHLVQISRRMKDYALFSDIFDAYRHIRCRGWRRFSLKGLQGVCPVEVSLPESSLYILDLNQLTHNSINASMQNSPTQM